MKTTRKEYSRYVQLLPMANEVREEMKCQEDIVVPILRHLKTNYVCSTHVVHYFSG